MDTSKIIIGTVGGGRYTVTSPIVKEDHGLYLKIEGLELPTTYEVDFSNSEHGAIERKVFAKPTTEPEEVEE